VVLGVKKFCFDLGVKKPCFVVEDWLVVEELRDSEGETSDMLLSAMALP